MIFLCVFKLVVLQYFVNTTLEKMSATFIGIHWFKLENDIPQFQRPQTVLSAAFIFLMVLSIVIYETSY